MSEPAAVAFDRACNAVIGMGVTYRCTLPRGHDADGKTEPHYVIDNEASVRRWKRWNSERLLAEGKDARDPSEYPGVYTEAEASVALDESPEAAYTAVEPREISGDIKLHEILVETVPTKQRPEDQKLPDGDESQPDIQRLVIADIEERLQVGISRYGQGLKAFNGRNTMQDAYEEAIDLAVYLKTLLVMREADRNRLVEVAAKELHTQIGVLFPEGTSALVTLELGGRIVDRIIDSLVVEG